MQEYLNIYNHNRTETIRNYEDILKKTLQSHQSNDRSFNYSFKSIQTMLDHEIAKINTPLYDNFPLSWHLFRSRADNYAKNSELLILSNEVKDQFNKEVTPKLKKEYSYEQFIKGITIWETLLYVTDTFKENSDLIEMMFKLNLFKGFKHQNLFIDYKRF